MNNRGIKPSNEDNSISNESENEYSIVEKEITDNTPILMEKPFDPTLINIDIKTPSLDTLIERIIHKEIQLETSSYFQREPNLWDDGKKSRLIESILIRFPLPAFYFDGSDNSKWLVVDGLQRLSSIKQFVVDNNLRLSNLEFLTQLNGKSYQELDRDLQRIIKETQIVIYVINPGTPVDVKFNIFKRINTGGIVLQPQEIRHALFQGAPADFIAELAALPEFEEATAGSFKKNHRMLDRDFATRFLGFYLFGYQNYKPDLDTFMNKAMAAVYKMKENEKEKIKEDYRASLILNNTVFGDHAFRKIDPDAKNRKPINKAVFDAFSVQFALLTPNERNVIALNKEMIVEGYIKLLNSEDQRFFWSVSSSTDDKHRVFLRHSLVKDLIIETLQTFYDTINRNKEFQINQA